MKSILSFLFLLSSCSLYAQIETEEALLQEIIPAPSSVPVQSQLFILQAGEGNQVSINASPDQTTEIIQSGNLQQVVIGIQGEQNQVKVEQEGLENGYQLNLDGNHNQTRILQQGVSNTVVQDLQGVESLDIELIQIGAGHELIQLQQGGANAPIKVIQQGSPTSIIIEKFE